MEPINQFQKVFDHWIEYRVIYCRTCRYCTPPHQVRRHLQEHHPHIIPTIREQITQAVSSIKDIAWQPEEVQYPPVDCEPIPGLEVHRDVYQCTGRSVDNKPCEYMSLTIDPMQKHYKQDHQWKNTQSRGGGRRGQQQQTPNRMWVNDRTCQRFFHVAPWKKYFPVQPRDPSSNPITVNEIVIRGQQELAADIKAIEEYQEEKKIDSKENRYEANPWLDRAGWKPHLAQYSKKELVELIAHPQREKKVPGHDDIGNSGDDNNESEPMLWRACQVTKRVIKAAQAACHPNVTGLHTLEYINRRETGQINNEKPFYGRQMGKSIKKYTAHWVHILCYIWRTHDVEDPNPPYQFTRRQARCLRSFQNTIETFENERRLEIQQQMDDACLTFWIMLLDHPLGDHQYESAILSGTAVIGWDDVSGMWRPATVYTPILSAITTVARMLVVFQAHRRRMREVQRFQGPDHGYSEEDARRRAPSHYSLVQEMVQRFMTLTTFNGQPSPMNFIFKLRTYGMTIRMNTPADGAISWDGDQINCGGIHFRMHQLRSMIHGLVVSTREQLWRELLFLDVDDDGRIKPGCVALPPLNLDELFDNPSELRDGWNFLQDPRNQFAVDGTTWLYNRVLSEPRLRQRLIHPIPDHDSGITRIPWREDAIQQFFKAVGRFKENQYALKHMTNGGPWRGSEGITIPYRNTANGDGRGYFVDHGMLHLVSGYHKGYGLSGKLKQIHRFLPREVSEPEVYYLWLVEPFVQIMQMKQYQQKEFSPWICEPDPNAGGEDEDEEDDPFAEVSEDQEREMEAFEVDAEGDPGPDVVSTDPVRRALNVDGYWGSSRVRYILQRVCRAGMGTSMTIQAWRHIVKAIIREYSRDRRVLDVINDEHGLEMGPDDIHDRAFGHGTRIGGFMYGRDLMEAPNQTMSEREAFRRVSVEWHRFLQFASTQEMDAGITYAMGLQATAVSPEIRQQQQRRWEILRNADLQQGLREMFGDPSATFRGGQQEILQAIIQRRSPIVAIQATSFGKSLLFMLPAAMSPHGMRIVVVPLVSLQENMADRCRKMGIRCVIWHPHHPADGAQIVLVTPEGTTSEAFQHFINRQRMLGVLDGYVVDEAHVVMESVKGWRPEVRRAVGELPQHQTQLLYLTATLKPQEEATFYRITGIIPEQVVQFRGSTTRANIQYLVQPYDIKEEEISIQVLVDQKRQQYPLPGQIIVYCASVKQTELLAELLGCSVYHRNVGNALYKREILDRLVLGQEQVFTATNALGLGIDRASIRVVIHMGVPRQMRSFAQESGRAGRDQLRSESIIMRAGYRNGQGQWQAQKRSGVEEEMQSFVETPGCRRVILDYVMDGREDRIACEEGEEMCDICEGRMRRQTRVTDQAINRDETLVQSRSQTFVGSSQMLVASQRQVEEQEEIRKEGEADNEETGQPEREFEEEEEDDYTREGRGKRRRVISIIPGRPRPVQSETDVNEEQEEVSVMIMKKVRSQQEQTEPVSMIRPFEREERRAWIAQQVQQEQKREEGMDVQRLVVMLAEWHDRCALCVVQGQGEAGHQLSECGQREAAQAIINRREQIRERIREKKLYERFAGCQWCGMPQEICDQWERKASGRFRRNGRKSCQYRTHFHIDVIMAVTMYGEMMWPELLYACIEQDEGETVRKMIEEDEIQEMTWWCSRLVWGGMETSQLIRVFYRCGRMAEERMQRC
jgi:superfamily II DNA helicase RecQ